MRTWVNKTKNVILKIIAYGMQIVKILQKRVYDTIKDGRDHLIDDTLVNLVPALLGLIHRSGKKDLLDKYININNSSLDIDF